MVLTLIRNSSKKCLSNRSNTWKFLVVLHVSKLKNLEAFPALRTQRVHDFNKVTVFMKLFASFEMKEKSALSGHVNFGSQFSIIPGHGDSLKSSEVSGFEREDPIRP